VSKKNKPGVRQASWKLALSGLGLAVVATGTVIAGGTSAAVVAPETVNPFDINQGFTIVSQGDAHLNNGEIEGSIASFGSISTGNQNGYPVIHTAAGEPNYPVPTIDGTPVRILANNFTGAGAFDVSNRDDSGTIDAGSPEATAVVKLVDTAGLTGAERGNFLRITNAEAGIIDLKTVPFAGSDVADYTTARSSVASYFAGLDAHVALVNECLSAMYAPDLGLSNKVSVEGQDGIVFVSNFATDQPNVIDYAAMAGKTIKLDNAAGYKPTAGAPLVIRVAPGTTNLGKLSFEGWSSQAGAQQSLANFILLDLSEVTGDVTVNGLELGAIWAPSANLNFNSGVTTNGQWFAKGVTTNGGEVHTHLFQAQLPCGTEAAATTFAAAATTTAAAPTTADSTAEASTTDDATTSSAPAIVAAETGTTDPGSQAAVDTDGPSSDDELAQTGAQTAWPLAGGAALLRLGGLALMFIRRGNHA
jgi:hypothetical protein